MNSITVFFIVMVMIFVVGMPVDHVINYETWGSNENFFVNDFVGYEVTCDIRYFQDPTNCRAIDEHGVQVPNEVLKSLINDECYFTNESGNVLPCTMD